MLSIITKHWKAKSAFLCVCFLRSPLRPLLSSQASWSRYGFSSDTRKDTKSARVAGRNQAVTSLLIWLPELQDTSCMADAYLTNLSSEEILFLDLGGFVCRSLKDERNLHRSHRGISRCSIAFFRCSLLALYSCPLYIHTWEISTGYANVQWSKARFHTLRLSLRCHK